VKSKGKLPSMDSQKNGEEKLKVILEVKFIPWWKGCNV